MSVIRGFILLLLVGLWPSCIVAQQSSGPYTFEWEVVAVDSIPGMATVRLYAKLVNPTDYLTSVSGWDGMEGFIETTTSFYQHPDGWATPNNNNPLIFGPLPELEWDSWVTIGIDAAPDGGAGEIPVGLFPPQTSFWVEDFEAGGNVNMDVDGAWFVTLGSSNGLAGEDLKVLVGQFTTDGVLSGILNLQVFSEGSASEEFMDDVYSVLIPEFDATGLSLMSEQEIPLRWESALESPGVWRHQVGSGVESWQLFGFTGELLESASIARNHFLTTASGIVVLRNAEGGIIARRYCP